MSLSMSDISILIYYLLAYREPYLQHFILFVTYEWALQARVFSPGKLDNVRVKRLAREKHSSLVSPFLIYEANEVL
jgi:hypothetical protein